MRPDPLNLAMDRPRKPGRPTREDREAREAERRWILGHRFTAEELAANDGSELLLLRQIDLWDLAPMVAYRLNLFAIFANYLAESGFLDAAEHVLGDLYRCLDELP